MEADNKNKMLIHNIVFLSVKCLAMKGEYLAMKDECLAMQGKCLAMMEECLVMESECLAMKGEFGKSGVESLYSCCEYR